MGSANKLLLKYNNHTIIEEVFEQLSNSKVDEILIVTGFERERIEGLLNGCLTDRMKFIYNGNYHLGRAESIKCAVRHIKGKADVVLFMVADKPRVSTTLINRAIDRYRRDRPAILYVQTPTGRGHPIIFSKELFDDLLSLSGDQIGDELVARCKDDVIELNDSQVQVDIDTRQDYGLLIKEGYALEECKGT